MPRLEGKVLFTPLQQSQVIPLMLTGGSTFTGNAPAKTSRHLN
jgi:hypothetical protein